MTKPSLALALALASFLMIAGVAAGQQQKGDSELQIQGSLTLDFNSGGQDNGTVSLTWGRFFTDNQEAGLIVTSNVVNGDLLGNGGPFWRFNFGSGKTVPYFGLAATTNFGDFDGSGDILLDLEGGIRWFIQRNIAFSLAGRTSYDVDRSDLDDQLQVLFGFSYFWKK